MHAITESPPATHSLTNVVHGLCAFCINAQRLRVIGLGAVVVAWHDAQSKYAHTSQHTSTTILPRLKKELPRFVIAFALYLSIFAAVEAYFSACCGSPPSSNRNDKLVAAIPNIAGSLFSKDIKHSVAFKLKETEVSEKTVFCTAQTLPSRTPWPSNGRGRAQSQAHQLFPLPPNL